jgi:NAD(P)H dehydrogenase (quinone)
MAGEGGGRVAVIVDSRYGSTLALARALAAGAEAEGAEVRLRRVGLSEPEFSVETERASYRDTRAALEDLAEAEPEDLRWADAIAWGSPTRYGLMTTALKAFIDRLAPLWREGALIGKPGAAFTSSGGMHSGNEMTLLCLLLPFLQHGMVVVGVPHSVPELVHTRFGGGPYGASAVTGFEGDRPVDEAECAIAAALGARLARLGRQIRPEPAPVLPPP